MLVFPSNVTPLTNINPQKLNPRLSSNGNYMGNNPESGLEGGSFKIGSSRANSRNVSNEIKHKLVSRALDLYHADKLQLKYADSNGMVGHLAKKGSESIIRQMLVGGNYTLEIVNGIGYLIRTDSLLGGARTLAETKLALEAAVIAGKKVVFISYRWLSGDLEKAHPDVDRLCTLLENAGIFVLKDRESFGVGDRVDEYMQLIAHPGINQTIIIADEGYFKSRNCMYEMSQAYRHVAANSSMVTVIPMDGRLFAANRFNQKEIIEFWESEIARYGTTNQMEVTLAQNILAAIPTFLNDLGMQIGQTLADTLKRDAAPLLDFLNKCPRQMEQEELMLLGRQQLNLAANPNYVGRHNERFFILNKLASSKIVTLQGPGGMGKSSLVNQALLDGWEQVSRLYPDGIVLVEFNMGISVLQAMAQVVFKLDPHNDGKDIPRSYQQLLRTKRILLLLDGAEDARLDKETKFDVMLAPIAQSKSGAIITTRRHDERPNADRVLRLNFLSDAEQYELLVKSLDGYESAQNPKELTRILSYLGGLPLAIALAGAYLSSSNLPLAEYIKELETSPFEILNKDQAEATDHHQGIAYLIKTNVAQLDKLLQGRELTIARQVLMILGNLAYASVPLARIRSIISAQNPDITTRELTQLMTTLQQLGLIKVASEGSFILVHSLVYRYVQDNKEELQLNSELMAAMINSYSNWLATAGSNKEEWVNIDKELPHIIAMLNLAFNNNNSRQVLEIIDYLKSSARHDNYSYYIDNSSNYPEMLEILELRLNASAGNAKEVGLSLIKQGELHIRFGFYDLALGLFKQAKDLTLAECGSGSIEYAKALYWIGIANDYKGLYPEALSLYEEALIIRKAELGADHPDVASSLSCIAGVYHSQGDYPRALEMYQEVLALRKVKLGAGHPDVASSLSCIAGVYYSKGDYPKALEMYQEVLALRKAKLGVDHPSVASSLSCIAGVYYSQGDYPRALELQQEVLAMRKAKLGADHPSVADTLNDIAVVYDSQGSYDRALEMYQESLVITKAKLGEDHPDVANTLNNIALVHCSLGDYPRSLELYNKVLTIREAKLGTNHPLYGNTLQSIGFVYDLQGNYVEAMKIYQRALEIQISVLGIAHPDVAIILARIAGVHFSQGNYDQALEMYQGALDSGRLSLGNDHRYIAIALDRIGEIYYAQGKYDDAMKMHQDALVIGLSKLGATHPDVATMMNNIASVHSVNGLYDQALETYNKVLTIREAKLGTNHLDVAVTLNNMAWVYFLQGKSVEAIAIYQRSLDIYKAKGSNSTPGFANALYNISMSYQALGRISDAIEHMGQAHDIYVKIYGVNHSKVKDAENKLANLNELLSTSESPRYVVEESRPLSTEAILPSVELEVADKLTANSQEGKAPDGQAAKMVSVIPHSSQANFIEYPDPILLATAIQIEVPSNTANPQNCNRCCSIS